MLSGFSLKYGNITINATNGLVQESSLSPILFNIFLNDLLNKLDRDEIHNLTYADDLAWCCQNIDQTKRAIEIVKDWCERNDIKINYSKRE